MFSIGSCVSMQRNTGTAAGPWRRSSSTESEHTPSLEDFRAHSFTRTTRTTRTRNTIEKRGRAQTIPQNPDGSEDQLIERFARKMASIIQMHFGALVARRLWAESGGHQQAHVRAAGLGAGSWKSGLPTTWTGWWHNDACSTATRVRIGAITLAADTHTVCFEDTENKGEMRCHDERMVLPATLQLRTCETARTDRRRLHSCQGLQG